MKCKAGGNKIILEEINNNDSNELLKIILKKLGTKKLILDLSAIDKLPTQIIQIILSAHINHGVALNISSNLTKEIRNYGIQI